MNSIDLSSYQNLFLKTAHEYLTTLKTKFSLLKQSTSDADEKFELYRLMHSFKSRSLFLGYKQIGLICKTLEDIFRAIKENKIILSDELFNTVNNIIQKMVTSLDNIAKNQVENDFADDIKQLETFLIG